MHLKSIRFKTTLTNVWTGASITSLFLASGQIGLTLLLMGTRAPGPSLVQTSILGNTLLGNLENPGISQGRVCIRGTRLKPSPE